MNNDNKQAARVYAAQINRRIASECLTDAYGWADHVTQEYKERYAREQLAYAEEIEKGLHDHNFTIWQRMNYYLTGESVALLP